MKVLGVERIQDESSYRYTLAVSKQTKPRKGYGKNQLYLLRFNKDKKLSG